MPSAWAFVSSRFLGVREVAQKAGHQMLGKRSTNREKKRGAISDKFDKLKESIERAGHPAARAQLECPRGRGPVLQQAGLFTFGVLGGVPRGGGIPRRWRRTSCFGGDFNLGRP